ncbi:MAG: hypothetical protein GEU96_14410 [Propionibacteriales bacterium]|nr:hypothetical protein [Propionibacteriales bacterium]
MTTTSRRTGVWVAAVVLALVGAIGVLVGSRDTGSRGAAVPEPTATNDPQTQRAADAESALFAVEQAVADADRQAFTNAFDPGAESRAAGFYSMLRRLPLSTYTLRFVSPAGGSTGTADRWAADVEARWAIDGYDERPVSTEVRVTFTGEGDDTRVVDIARSTGERIPEWLLGQASVRKAGSALVISANPRLTERIDAQARRAVDDVQDVVTDWPGRLVVVVPRDAAQLEGVLASEPGHYDEIAAVTTTADDASDADAPVRIVLNPAVYQDLGTTGSQVVLSHEATHAATGAAATDAPLWLVEGFADYVALVDAPVSVEVAASQIIGQVRKSGVPKQLPSKDDFATRSGRLGASYEAAWLVCRMVADQRGEAALLRLYESALESGDVDAALADTLDSDVPMLTRQWRDYLGELAGD